MKNKRVISFCSLLLVLGLLTWQLFAGDRNKNADIAQSLLGSKALDTRYDTLINYSFSTLINEMELGYKINVNKKYERDKLNIFVVKFAALDSQKNIGGVPFQEFSAIVHNNFIAMPPNIILIDRDFLAFLILSCFDELTGYLEGLAQAKMGPYENAIKHSKVVESFEAINMYLGMGNYAWYRKWYTTEGVSLDRMSAIIVNQLNKDIISASDERRQMFYLYYLPIIAHEMAHIKNNDGQPMGWFDFEKAIQNQMAGFQQEKKADDWALHAIEHSLRQDTSADVNVIAIMAFCKTMRNMVLSETYKDFRGREPVDMVVTLEQRDSLSKELLEEQFCNPDRVARAYENLPPPMSETEFSAFVNRLNKSGSDLSHRHMFRRCADLIKLVDDNLHGHTGFLDKYIDILSVAGHNDAYKKKLFTEYSHLDTTGLSKGKLLENLIDSFDMQKAVNYENNHIEIGFLKNGNGYVELYGDSNNLNMASLIIKNDYQFLPVSKIDSKTVNLFMTLFLFLVQCYKDGHAGYPKIIDAFTKIKNNIDSPPAFSIDGEDNTIRFTPQNESHFLRVDVYRKQQ